MKNKFEVKEKKVEEVQETKLGFFLVVKLPFRNFKRGDRIFERGEITAILGCHEKAMVNQVLIK